MSFDSNNLSDVLSEDSKEFFVILPDLHEIDVPGLPSPLAGHRNVRSIAGAPFIRYAWGFLSSDNYVCRSQGHGKLFNS